MIQHFNQRDEKQARRQARADMPPAEALLWSKLQRRQLLGCKFRRQYSVETYRLDFYSPELKLGIELDGESHFTEGSPAYDSRRDWFIQSLGIRVLRILNSEVRENLDGVWDGIAKVAREQMASLGDAATRGRRVKRDRGGSETGRPTPPAPPS